MAGRVPASSVGRGIDEVLHLRRKWQENAGFFNLRSKNLLELIFEPGVCIREQKNENDIFSNYRICEILRRVLNIKMICKNTTSSLPTIQYCTFKLTTVVKTKIKHCLLF